jgi:hypothetical protein
MKNIIYAFLFLIMISCSEFLFENPQPENGERIKQVPKELWGFYKNNNDTLIISEYNFQLRSSLGIMNNLNFDLRNEEFVLKIQNEKYYLNVKKNEDNYQGWMLARFSKKGKELDFKSLENFEKSESDSTMNLSIKKIIYDDDGKRLATILKSESFEQYDKLLDSAESQIFKKR